ncbi:hypothetical protein DKX38_017428 [Salix brachista]|uniref:B-like cyclin n=1 Tax=Salix brachista TaxID=2182728 RepID=A0A5N5KVD6_9ROSI|nr:hypothetical protein DKX38_017428 [Salix brachista]
MQFIPKAVLHTQFIHTNCVKNGRNSTYCSNNSIKLDTFPILLEQDLSWEDDELSALFAREEQNQLCKDLETNPSLARARCEAVEWILKVNSYYSFTALTAVLAVNYLDRFLSSVHLQKEKPWMTQLAAVSCLSLAAKVEETQVPLLLDFQVDMCIRSDINLQAHLLTLWIWVIYGLRERDQRGEGGNLVSWFIAFLTSVRKFSRWLKYGRVLVSNPKLLTV